MAERRMFSKTVTGSARFLMMSAAARLLYYDLGMQADDDGCVEAMVVLRLTDAPMEALDELVDEGFVMNLTPSLVCWISHWRRNNLIRADRYHEGAYRRLIPDQPEEL